jgi:hypothetical protein
VRLMSIRWLCIPTTSTVVAVPAGVQGLGSIALGVGGGSEPAAPPRARKGGAVRGRPVQAVC